MSRLTPRDRFAANLKRERKKADISQIELGSRCDLYGTEISLLERSRREPRLGMIVKLADALGISVERLCEGMAWDVEDQRFKFKR